MRKALSSIVFAAVVTLVSVCSIAHAAVGPVQAELGDLPQLVAVKESQLMRQSQTVFREMPVGSQDAVSPWQQIKESERPMFVDSPIESLTVRPY